MLMNNFKNSKYDISKFGLGTVQFGLDYGFTKTVDEENRYVFTYEEISIELILDSQKMSQITIGLELTWDISR